MAKKQRVLRIQHDNVANTATLYLACGHTFKIEGWTVVMGMGPLDISERECRECDYESDFSRADSPMVDLRGRILRQMEQLMVDGWEIEGKIVIDVLDRLNDLIDEAIEQLADRFGNEVHSWKQGNKSLRAKLLKLGSEARGGK